MTVCAIFDFADTLAELHPSPQEIIGDYVQRVSGIRVDREIVSRALWVMNLLLPYSSLETRTQDQRTEFYLQFNDRLFQLLGVTHRADPAGLITHFRDREAHWVLKPGALDTLRALRAHGYSIGIISNFDRSLENIVYERLQLNDEVSYVHISQREGLEKPDPHFYLAFFRRHGISIRRATYIGDSYTLDFLPATSIGLHSWLLDETSQYCHLPEATRSIRDVPALVTGFASAVS